MPELVKSDPMAVVLLGRPGAGKSTQARILSERFGFARVSPGEFLRRQIEEGTPLGLAVAPDVNAGKILSNDLVLAPLLEEIERQGGGRFVLDGFPRTRAHAAAFDRSLEDRDISARVILLDIGRDDAVRRISGRFNSQAARRADDAPDVVAARFDLYEKETALLADHYRGRGELSVVDANAPMEEVAAGIGRALLYQRP